MRVREEVRGGGGDRSSWERRKQKTINDYLVFCDKSSSSYEQQQEWDGGVTGVTGITGVGRIQEGKVHSVGEVQGRE